MQKDLTWEAFTGAIRTYYVRDLYGVADLGLLLFLREQQAVSNLEV
jgi:hypothetical protein